jgi:hypothetical protein
VERVGDVDRTSAIRPRFACRTRLAQGGVLWGFVGGGFALQYGASLGRPLEDLRHDFLPPPPCADLFPRVC